MKRWSLGQYLLIAGLLAVFAAPAHALESGATSLTKTMPPKYTLAKPMLGSLATTIGGALAAQGLIFAGVFALDHDYDPTGNRGEGMVIAGMSLHAASLIFGPAVGQFYLGNKRRAWSGVLIRSSALVAGFFSFWGGFALSWANDGSSGSEAAIGLLFASFVINATIAFSYGVFDIASLPKDVRRANEAARRPKVAWSVTPAVLPTSRPGQKALGVGFGARF